MSWDMPRATKPTDAPRAIPCCLPTKTTDLPLQAQAMATSHLMDEEISFSSQSPAFSYGASLLPKPWMRGALQLCTILSNCSACLLSTSISSFFPQTTASVLVSLQVLETCMSLLHRNWKTKYVHTLTRVLSCSIRTSPTEPGSVDRPSRLYHGDYIAACGTLP